MKRVIVLILILLSSTVYAADNKVTVNFENQSLSSVINTLAKLSGYSIVFEKDSDRESQITWIQKDMTPYQLMKNFTIMMDGMGYKVKRIDTQKSYFLVTASDNYIAKTLDSSVGFYQFKYIKLENVEESIQKLFGQSAILTGSIESNVIVYTGSTASVKEIGKVIEKLDQPSQAKIAKVDLKYISVSEALKALKDLGLVEDNTVYPDYRNQAILFNGDNNIKRNIETALKNVDKKKKGFNIRVYHLTTQKAEDIQPIIEELFTECKFQKYSDNQFLLSGDEEYLSQAEEIIEKLDGTAQQVQVEAVIAYLTDQQYRQLGLNIVTNHSNAYTSLSKTGFTAVLGDLLEDYVSVLAGCKISAEDGQSNGSIISSPKLTVLNGHTAKLQVGRNVPYITETVTNDDGKKTGTSIQREDIGIEFEITPTIQPNKDFININVSSVISSIAKESELEQAFADIVLDKQEILTDVKVANGETIFLGGLKIQEEGSVTEYVPLLHYIPVLGDLLFTYDAKKKENRNLVVSLRVRTI